MTGEGLVGVRIRSGSGRIGGGIVGACTRFGSGIGAGGIMFGVVACFLRAPSGGRGRSQPGRAVESLIRQAIRRGGVDAATRKACNSALPGLFAQVAGTARDLPGSGESHRVSRAVLRSIQAPNP